MYIQYECSVKDTPEKRGVLYVNQDCEQWANYKGSTVKQFSRIRSSKTRLLQLMIDHHAM